MAQQPRRFSVTPAKRAATPLLVGLFGPSGSGKTYSALELATGIQSVVGGEIVMVDTENRRGLHYADKFDFKHIDMQPPFGSLDYLQALQFAVNEYGAKTVIVDSMSHEHEGPGGLLESHAAEVDKMARGDWKKAERVKMLAWNKPKQDRRALINGILRLQANMIFCFRAKATSKPVKGADGKNEVVSMGYMPIAGEEFVFEMTLAALLPPGARGVPDYNPQNDGERLMSKLPEDFAFMRDIAARKQPLDRRIGAGLARWAQGSSAPKDEPKPEPQREVPQLNQDNMGREMDRGDFDGGDAAQDDNPPPPSQDGPGYEGI